MYFLSLRSVENKVSRVILFHTRFSVQLGTLYKCKHSTHCLRDVCLHYSYRITVLIQITTVHLCCVSRA